MNASLHRKALAYLAEHNVMTLATTGTKGVWASALFYVNDGFKLYFLSSPRSRHSINLANHSAIAATIQEDYRDWRRIKGVQLEGVARKVRGIERVAAIGRYQAKFPFAGEAVRSPVEVVRAMRRMAWFKVEPSKLFFIDNSLGLGHRDEIALDRSNGGKKGRKPRQSKETDAAHKA